MSGPPPPIPLKKENSYTYWVSDNNKSRELPIEHRPQKVEVPLVHTTTTSGSSAWNTCGTWEEKKISLGDIQSKVSKRIGELLKDIGLEIVIDKVEINGDAYKVWKKNKWHVIYEVHGSLEFVLSEDKAKIKIIELSNLGDRDYELTGNAGVKKVLSSHSSELVKVVEDAINGEEN